MKKKIIEFFMLINDCGLVIGNEWSYFLKAAHITLELIGEIALKILNSCFCDFMWAQLIEFYRKYWWLLTIQACIKTRGKVERKCFLYAFMPLMSITRFDGPLNTFFCLFVYVDILKYFRNLELLATTPKHEHMISAFFFQGSSKCRIN